MKIQNKNKAYTLAELVVTMTILVILGTIWFMSFQGFSLDSRNVVRLTDVKWVKEALENMKLEQWKYPVPTTPQKITFKWAHLWTQWAFWIDTITATPALNTVPLDPLTQNEYTYAISREGTDYELGFAIEWDDYIDRSDLAQSIINNTHASIDQLLTFIDWDYEWKILTVSTGGIDYVLAIPTLILTSRDTTDIEQVIAEKKITYKWYEVLPLTYEYLDNNPTKIFDMSHQEMVVFDGDLENLRQDSYRLGFYEKLSSFYNSSQLRFSWEYEGFSSVYADMFNPTGNFSDIACKTTQTLLNIRCADYNVYGNLEWADGWTGALVVTQSGSYAGQWNFWRVFYSSRQQNTQELQWAEHARNTYGMAGNLRRAVWTKWKIFTKWKAPDISLWGYDINGDNHENIIYWYAGKLFLWDITNGWIIWESFPYDVRKILWVESILPDGSKSIIVELWPSWIVWVINGKTWKLWWTSTQVLWPVKVLKPVTLRASMNYKVFDIDGDGIREYHFKQWYYKYHSLKFSEQAWKVVWETLWSSQWYWDYNGWRSDWASAGSGYANYTQSKSDGYQVNQFAMWTINGDLVIWTKGSNTFTFYSNDVDSTLSGIHKFKMPAFWKIYTGWSKYRWRQSGLWYFYDLNWDWKDEYISRINEELYNKKMSRVAVSGVWSWTGITQYMSFSQPEVSNGWGGFVYQWQHAKPIPLKNISNPSDSYILTWTGYHDNNKDPYWDNRVMLKYKGANPSGYKKISNQNETYNVDIISGKFDWNIVGKPVWVFNNGTKDYIVTRKDSKYYFFKFEGIDSFSSLSNAVWSIAGSFWWNRFFWDYSLDVRREKNKDAGIFMSGFDTDLNGFNEFIVNNWWKFKLYEITDSGVQLKKSFGPISSVPDRWRYGFSEDMKDMYIITYNLTSNTINYYRTNSGWWDYTFTKRTDNQFSSGWEIKDLLISKLWSYNKLMIQGLGMFDARSAKPTTPPLKIWNDYFYSWDMDGDNENEVFKDYINASGTTVQWAFKFHSPWVYSQKFLNTWWVWDLDGDGVQDMSWAHCKKDPDNTYRVWFRSTSGATGNEIAPDIDWWVWTGWCSGWGIYAAVSEDFDGDWVDELAAWVAARHTRLISYSGSSVTEWNQVYEDADWYTLLSFDFNGDGIKEIIRWMDKANVFEWKKIWHTGSLVPLVNINWWVKSTAWIGWGTPTVFRKNNVTYIAFRGVDGQVSLRSWDWFNVKEHFNNYYLNTKVYSNSNTVIADKLIPLPTADILLWDFIWDSDVQVLVGGWDGYIYIIGLDWSIIKAYNVWAPIQRIIFGDTNGDDILDILVSAQDWYVHQISSSRLNPPSIIRDGQSIWSDDRYQHDPKRSWLHFPSVSTASGSFIQLYNKTQKSVVFDWIDVWTDNSICVVSKWLPLLGCKEAPKQFELIPSTLYQWRVQSYDNEVSSPIAVSNGFRLQ